MEQINDIETARTLIEKLQDENIALMHEIELLRNLNQLANQRQT